MLWIVWSTLDDWKQTSNFFAEFIPRNSVVSSLLLLVCRLLVKGHPGKSIKWAGCDHFGIYYSIFPKKRNNHQPPTKGHFSIHRIPLVKSPPACSKKNGNILDGQLAIYLIQLSAGVAGDEEYIGIRTPEVWHNPWKKDHPKRKRSSFNHHFSGAMLLCVCNWKKTDHLKNILPTLPFMIRNGQVRIYLYSGLRDRVPDWLNRLARTLASMGWDAGHGPPIHASWKFIIGGIVSYFSTISKTLCVLSEVPSWTFFLRWIFQKRWSGHLVFEIHTKSLCRYEANQATKRSWFLSFTRDVLKPRSLIGPRLISRSPGVGSGKAQGQIIATGSRPLVTLYTVV